jgi:aryl-alcohol dehydrogenase-like predicted oxidoreductase
MINRGIEKDIVPHAIKNDIAIIAYSPLQRGILTGKIKPGQLFNEGDTRQGNIYYSYANIEKVNSFLGKLKSIADKKNATLSQLVIRWTIDQPGITVALAGARNSQQAIENAGAAAIKISAAEMKFINDELHKLQLEI